jgi:D-alanyl-D-alanine dipeptidase
MTPPFANRSVPIGRKPLSGALLALLRKATLLRTLRLIVASGALCFSSASRAELPDGFVYLSDVDSSIIQDIRYYGGHNFVGRRIDGYGAPECVLTRKAALALSRIQTALRKRNVSLIVWDCYRPARAVADFMRWSKNPADREMKTEFFPNTAKSALFARGYISARSAHSRGSTVDLGLAPKDSSPAAFDPAAPLVACTAPEKERFHDGALDMGTGFDCFDSRATSASTALTGEAQKNRMRLRRAMIGGGFKPYDKEWWHFELENEPFPGKSFDFPVEPKRH